MSRSSFSTTSQDYDTHPAAVRPARLRPSVAPLPRLDEGRVRRASGAEPFGAISHLRALEVPRTAPFHSNHQTTNQP
jgi:hypothetical protein